MTSDERAVNWRQVLRNPYMPDWQTSVTVSREWSERLAEYIERLEADAGIAREAEARADNERKKARWIASMVSAGTSTEWGVVHPSGKVAVLFTGVSPRVVVADDALYHGVEVWLAAAEAAAGA